jgi:DNA-binding PadR family transcriptional regulator
MAPDKPTSFRGMANHFLAESVRAKVLRPLAEKGPMSAFGVQKTATERGRIVYSTVRDALIELEGDGIVELLREERNEKGGNRRIFGLTEKGLVAAIACVGTTLNVELTVDKYPGLFSNEAKKLERDILLALWKEVPKQIVWQSQGNLLIGSAFPEKVEGNPIWELLAPTVHISLLDLPKTQLEALKKNRRFRDYVAELRDSQAKTLEAIDRTLD